MDRKFFRTYSDVNNNRHDCRPHDYSRCVINKDGNDSDRGNHDETMGRVPFLSILTALLKYSISLLMLAILASDARLG